MVLELPACTLLPKMTSQLVPLGSPDSVKVTVQYALHTVWVVVVELVVLVVDDVEPSGVVISRFPDVPVAEIATTGGLYHWKKKNASNTIMIVSDKMRLNFIDQESLDVSD